MANTLSNREWAILFWVAVAFATILMGQRFQDARQGLKQVAITFFSRPILSVLALTIIYVGSLIYALYLIGLWDFTQTKNTIVWFVSVAWLSQFKLNEYKKDQKFYLDFAFSSIKLLAVIQFVLNFYSFSFLMELFLVFMLFILSMFLGVAQSKVEFKPVERLITNIFAIYGSILIVFTVYQMVINFSSFGNLSVAYDFFIPALLTLLYLPFILFLLVYTSYEVLPRRLKYSIKDPKLLRRTIYYVILRFRFRYKLLERWFKSLVYLNIQSFADIRKSVNDIFELVKVEKSPPSINTNRGWSPYDAINFLKEVGITAENYHPALTDEWFAASEYIKTSEERVFRNTIVYYVNGNATVANCLELYFNTGSLDSMDSTNGQMLFYAKVLFLNALDREIPEEIANAILKAEPSEYKIGFFDVVLKKESWSNSQYPGYNLEFSIKLSEIVQKRVKNKGYQLNNK